jgi:hypothetical protein
LVDVWDHAADANLPAFCLGGNIYSVHLTGLPYVIHHGLDPATRYSFSTYDQLLDHTALFVPARQVALLITNGPSWRIMEGVTISNRMHIGNLVFLNKLSCCAGGVITSIARNSCFLCQDAVRVVVQGCWADKEDGWWGHVFELDSTINRIEEASHKALMCWVCSGLACGMVNPGSLAWLRQHMIAFHCCHARLYWSWTRVFSLQ